MASVIRPGYSVTLVFSVTSSLSFGGDGNGMMVIVAIVLSCFFCTFRCLVTGSLSLSRWHWDYDGNVDAVLLVLL